MALVIKSNLKNHTELSISEEFKRQIEIEVENMMKKAEERAKANQRKTLLARDL